MTSSAFTYLYTHCHHISPKHFIPLRLIYVFETQLQRQRKIEKERVIEGGREIEKRERETVREGGMETEKERETVR